MYKIDWKRGALLSTLGVGMAWFATGPLWTQAEDPPREAGAKAPEERPTETHTGRVEKLLHNDRNDLDGLQLEGGQTVHFPPHEGAAVARIVKVGDTVKVTGHKVTRPRGEVVFEVVRLEQGTQSLTIERPRPPRGPHHRHERGEPMQAKGTVKEFHKNREGDVDGVILSDGTEVKLPPHQGAELQALLRVGDEVKVEGHRHETPRGDKHLHADRLTAVASGKTLEREGPPHERGHRHEGPRGHHAPPPPPHSEQFNEILKELKELRRLLEAQQKDR